MEKEIWKDIPNYEGLYLISSYGNIKILAKQRGFCMFKEKDVKPFIDKKGYSYFRLCKNGSQRRYAVHQIVAMVFLDFDPCGYKLVINHIDGNTQNNNYQNLEITTQRNNSSFCYRKDRNTKHSKYPGVCRDSYYKNKWRASIYKNKKYVTIGRFDTEEEAFNAYKKELNNL